MRLLADWKTRPSICGFTLIELLIVVAIIAIMTAASITVIVAPMQEQAFASLDHSRQAGEATFFARLVDDAHTTGRIIEAVPGKLVLQTAGSTSNIVTYYVDDAKRLRRSVSAAGDGAGSAAGAGAALLDDVDSFTVEQIESSPMWRIRLESGTTKYTRRLADSHELTLAFGALSWSGGVMP